jgi:hypothetical protein
LRRAVVIAAFLSRWELSHWWDLTVGWSGLEVSKRETSNNNAMLKVHICKNKLLGKEKLCFYYGGWWGYEF